MSADTASNALPVPAPLSALAAAIKVITDERAKEGAAVLPDDRAEYDRKAAARMTADSGEIKAATSIDTPNALTARLNTPAARASIVGVAYPSTINAKTGAIKVHPRAKAIGNAAAAFFAALDGLSSADQETVRAIILCEARGVAVGLKAARGSLTEHAPLAGECFKIK